MLAMKPLTLLGKHLFYSEKWYIHDPKKGKFRKIKFEELPQQPGHIFLKYEKTDFYDGIRKDYYTLFSPLGEELKVVSINLRYKPEVEHINMMLDEIGALAGHLAPKPINNSGEYS